MTVGELTCRFETAKDCAIVTLLPALNGAPWSEIEQAGNNLLEQVRNSPVRVVIVDLTPLNYMGSALVALIVRVWKTVKEREGQFVVVSTDPMVFEVLKIAGLSSLWTVVETREAAFDAAGISSQAVTRKRETRLLTVVGPLAVLAAGAGLALLILRINAVPGLVAVGLALGWAALGLIVGGVTFARSSGRGRAVAGLVMAACVGIAVATAFFWPGNLAAGDEPEAKAPPAAAAPLNPASGPAAAGGAAGAEPHPAPPANITN